MIKVKNIKFAVRALALVPICILGSPFILTLFVLAVLAWAFDSEERSLYYWITDLFKPPCRKI